jgi:hypothetical protein
MFPQMHGMQMLWHGQWKQALPQVMVMAALAPQQLAPVHTL